jgi:hypothetical protein
MVALQPARGGSAPNSSATSHSIVIITATITRYFLVDPSNYRYWSLEVARQRPGKIGGKVACAGAASGIEPPLQFGDPSVPDRVPPVP